jgi:hypothetical protein
VTKAIFGEFKKVVTTWLLVHHLLILLPTMMDLHQLARRAVSWNVRWNHVLFPVKKWMVAHDESGWWRMMRMGSMFYCSQGEGQEGDTRHGM